MTVETAGFLIAGLLAVGVFSLVLGLSDGFRQLVRRLLLFTHRPLLRIPGAGEEEAEEAFDPYGLDRAPWEALRLVGAGVGVGMAALLFWERSPYLAVLGLAGGYAPSMVRTYLLHRAKRSVDVEVRHFLRTLKGVAPAYGGLYPALKALSGTQGGIIEERLQIYMRTGKNAIEMLAALAVDLHSQQLSVLATRLREAQEGLDRPGKVLEDTLQQLEREVFRAMKEAIGGAPIRLLIPMLTLMVPPVLVLVLYPPVARLIALISTGSGEPGW